MIILGTLVVLAGVGIMWLWQYAYTPEGRARVIIAQLKGDNDKTLRGWMLQHHVVRQGFAVPLQITPPYNDPMEYLGISMSNDWMAAAAADETVKIGHEVLPIVIESLRDENLEVRMMAIRACGKFRDPAAIQPLARYMRESISKPRRPPRIFGPEFVDLDQFWCLESLVEIGPEGYGALLKATNGCDTLRQAIPAELADKWGAAAIPRLLELLEGDEPYMRSFAARALGKLRDKRATEALIAHLSESDDYVVMYSAKALGEIGDQKAIPALLRAIKGTHGESRTCISVAGALARLGRGEGLDYLLSKLKSPDPGDRCYAAEELGTTRIKAALEPLLSLLSDNGLYVRSYAVEALGKLHDARAIPAVKKLLNDSDPQVSGAAIDALKELGVKPPPGSPIRASQTSQPGKP